MDITDGETTGGDGLPGPASRKLQGTTNQKLKAETLKPEIGPPVGQVTTEERKAKKRKSGKRKAEAGKKKTRDAAAGVEVQVNLVPPEKQAAVKAVIGPPLPVTGMPRAKGKKSMAAQFMLVLTLASTSIGLSIGLGHASSHNPMDGSHKTVQVQTSARREEVGGQVLPDGAGEKRKAESENRKEDHGLQTTADEELHRAGRFAASGDASHSQRGRSAHHKCANHDNQRADAGF